VRRGAAVDDRRRPSDLAAETDEQLLAGVKRGSERHFDALYQRYFNRIYGFLRLRVRNRADAEELTQEVFTAVFRSASGFGARASALSWVYGIARNTLLNHLRRRQLDRARFAQLSPQMLAPPASQWSYTPEEQVRLERFGAELRRRIGTLSRWQLDAFHLRHVEDLTIEEIARRIVRSEDSVRSGLYRAKQLLLDAAGTEEGAR
jgi:RNA polymerase sigma-70 factor (ECF subfamily)